MTHSLQLFLYFFLFFLLSCNADHDNEADREYPYNWDAHIPFKTNYSTFHMPVSQDFDPLPVEMGEVEMSEASGLAWSIKNPGLIWSHNDSGHTNTIFLIDASTGEIVARYKISGTHNLDWEDIEVSVGPVFGESYIYIADTGDNDEKRPNYSIYRFIEPTYDESHRGRNISITDIKVDRIRFQYPDGSHDAEGLLVDPATKDIFLVTKRDVVSMLFVVPYPQKLDSVYTIFKAGEFSFREASAATSSISGDEVLIKNRQEIFYWKRQEDESMTDMLSRTPVKAPYIGEPQGEAICFDNGLNYFTLSEALNSSSYPQLYKYNRK